MPFSFSVSDTDRKEFVQGELERLESVYTEAFPDISGEADLLLVDRAKIQELNREYRSLDEPTDVLSFPTLNQASLFPTKTTLLGSIVICPSKAEEYKEQLIDLTHHGLLHLLGFDHEEDRVEWQSEEKRILEVASRHGLSLTGIPHDAV